MVRSLGSLARKSKIQDGLANLPSPPFEALYAQKERIRHTLAAYVYLNKIRKSDAEEFKELKNVLEILEKSIIDLHARAAVLKHAEAIVGLM